MVGRSNQNVFLIQIDASSFAEFEISEFEISRLNCILSLKELLVALLFIDILVLTNNFMIHKLKYICLVFNFFKPWSPLCD